VSVIVRSITADCADPGRVAGFWAAALGWAVQVVDHDGAVVAGSQPGIPRLLFLVVPEPKTVKNRMHLDLATASAEHQAAEVGRLRGLGATPADIGQGTVPWVVLADPEGNELCVLEPRDVYRDTGPVAAIVIDCADPAAIARFWGEATGWQPHDRGEGLAALRSPAGTGPYLEMIPVPDPKRAKNRWHLDLQATTTMDAEVGRLAGLGASVLRRVAEDGSVFTVMADIEGNEFCVERAPAERQR
jgi:predicted enzyme related to lactoylglutathione lyase